MDTKRCTALIPLLVCLSHIYKQTDISADVFIHTFILKIWVGRCLHIVPYLQEWSMTLYNLVGMKFSMIYQMQWELYLSCDENFIPQRNYKPLLLYKNFIPCTRKSYLDD